MAIPGKQKLKEFTYKDYLSWTDDERWEIIDGSPYSMSHAPSRKHQAISRELERQIANFLLNKSCEVFDAPFDVRLSEEGESNEETSTIVQPDIIVVCDENKLDDNGCIGAPDIVIEIISPATAVKDKKIKFSLYERHGVKEYWIVEPADNTIMVFKLGKNKEYSKPGFFSKEDKLKTPILKDLEIDLNIVFQQ